jgi:hypothetical protein
MTELEFNNLKTDTIVQSKFQREEKFWRVYSTYEFGPPIKVCGIEMIDSTPKRFGRIDKSNCEFWDVVGFVRR